MSGLRHNEVVRILAGDLTIKPTRLVGNSKLFNKLPTGQKMHDLFETKPQAAPKALANDGFLRSAEEREADFRTAYANALDAKGKRLGKKRGDERYERMKQMLDDLEDSVFNKMRRENEARARAYMESRGRG